MLDINLFRAEKGGNPDIVRESQRRRHKDVTLVDKVVELDKQWRESRFRLDKLNQEFNRLNKEIGNLKKAKADEAAIAPVLAESKKVDEAIAAAKAEEDALRVAVENAIIPIGNLVHDSVPVSDNEDMNTVERMWGEPRMDCQWNHVDLIEMLGFANTDKGSEVAGNRGYYLTGAGTLLNLALINYAMAFLYKKGFIAVQTPFFLKREVMAECAQLEQFDEELYKVSGEGDDKYLIATSEQSLCCLHRKDWIDPKILPRKYAGYSTCFRKEVGSHGRDTLGIFRVHQFEKVEQFIMCSPHGEESWRMMDEMIANSEDFYQSLEIPYRIVNIVSGALNNAAAKKYDLEAWFPASKTYRELVSCSNCTDYQARRLETRFGNKKVGADARKEYVHLLNSTLSATERTLCCVLENHQTAEGFKVPAALLPFMHGIEFVPYISIPKASKK
eukprot:jgi/Mesvir1/9716/Mv12187-RA.1